MMEVLKKWEKEEKYFIKTRASEYVMNCILKNPCVSVIGSSGVGKTFLVQHVALEMNKNDYRIMKVNSPKEIETHYISNRKTLFVVDDMCGNFTASKSKSNDWKIRIDNINVLLQTYSCKLILTCRLQVFQDEGFKHSNFEVFKNCICNLNNDKLCLTIFEKQELAKQYFKGTIIDIEHLFQYNFFPFLCQYYARYKRESNFCLKTFLGDPFASFETNINNLFVDDQTGKYKFCALLLLVLCNNHIESKYLEGEKDKFKIILKDIQKKCRIDKQLTVERLILELHTLTGTFVKDEEGIFKTIHDKFFDFLTHYFGTKNGVTKTEFIELLIRHANYKLIEERFVIKESDQSDDKKSKEYTITIEKREDNDQLQLYTERVFNDMTKADRYLWLNRNHTDKTFKETFKTFIKELKKDDKLHFIKNASSLFVRRMFVIDVNDLINFPCGIILDQEHLKEFVERIFGDLTKSDDIRYYISECKCCRNERFRTELLTFMRKLSIARIQKLIENANIIFVQHMFVMKEEDIKQSMCSSHGSYSFHECYGIEIQNDDMQMYLQRVVMEMINCTDVPSYISMLRCSRNKDFNTALQRFMNNYLSITIQKLKTASISFIQVMCVFMEEDIKHNSPHVYERYGFKIPCDARKEYIERVFDDMTMSDDVDKHIKGNRNRTNTIFQTGFLEFMSQLGESKIELMIKNASFDFLNRICVLTVDDIDDCDNTGKYGVFIPEVHIQLYIDRWFDGMPKQNQTENYVKQNRNEQGQKFIISLRRHLELLPESKIKNLIQTASSDFVNKWFVIEGEDIDTRKECEKYGIVLEGKCLQMYFDRIWTLMKWHNNFIQNMNCNRNIRYVLKYISQHHESHITELTKTLSVESFHKIEVDMQNELEKEPPYWQSLDYVRETIFELKEGIIAWPCSLIKLYMNRMVFDWMNGCLYAVIENVNMKNQCFVEKFVDHLNHLRPSEISQLVNGISQHVKMSFGTCDSVTALTVCCIYKDVNLAKWCVESQCLLNRYKKHYNMCALFMLLAFNNKLEKQALLDETQTVKEVITSFERNHDICHVYVDISAKLLCEALDTSLQGIVVKENGVYHVINDKVLNYLFFYFGTMEHFLDTLIEYADVKLLYIAFMGDRTDFHPKSIKDLPDRALQRCRERVFESMSESNRNFKDIIDYGRQQFEVNDGFFSLMHGNDHMNIEAISIYNGYLQKETIEKLIKNSCNDFFSNCFLIPTEEEKDDINVKCKTIIVLPDECIPIYIQKLFDNMIKSECVEACIDKNINKKNKNFHKKLSTFLKAIHRDDIKNLITESTSDFVGRMFVISAEDIKYESYWECDRYGIVVPDNLLQMYIQRVYVDITHSIKVPENRNNENIKFRNTLHSFISTEDNLSSLIRTASSKLISHLFLSTEGDLADLVSQRRECYYTFVSPQIYKVFKNHFPKIKNRICFFKGFVIDMFSFPDNSTTFTSRYRLKKSERRNVLLSVNFRNDKVIDNLNRHPTTRIFTNKTLSVYVRSTKSIEEQYILRMIQDWNDGKVHDVLGNINLRNLSFQSKFIMFLKNTNNEKQTKLAKTNDMDTGDSSLAVCCYVGISKLAEWCLENNSDTNSTNEYGEHPLYLACYHMHLDLVQCLLNHKNKPDVNMRTEHMDITPLYLACEKGLTTMLQHLLKEEAEVNYLCDDKTPLFVACKYGHNDIVRCLLELKKDEIDINKGTSHSLHHGHMTPLFIACKYGHNIIVKLLLEQNQDTIYINKGKEMDKMIETPLFIACKGGNTECVSLLLNHNYDEVDVNKPSFTGETPLYAACKGGYKDIVSLLLGHKSQGIIKSKPDGSTSIFVACQKGRDEVVSSLLNQQGIEKDKYTLTGMSPLFIASLLNHTHIAEMLLSRSADVNICIKNKDTVSQEFKIHRKKYPYQVSTTFRQSLCIEGFIKSICKLICDNASGQVKSYIDGLEEDRVAKLIFGSSPLHIGSLMGHIQIVTLLVDSTSSINCFTENGSTPLFLACELGHENIVRVLLDNKANPTLERKDGKSPLLIARENGHLKIEEIITQTVKDNLYHSESIPD